MSSALSEHLLGILCAHEGRYYAAEQAFLNAVEVEPEMACSYVELGLVYACRGEYREMIEALRRAVEVGAGAVRAYLGGRPLGDIAEHGAAGDKGGREALLPLTTAMAHLAEGRDAEAAAMLEQSLEGKPNRPPIEVALLALAYLLQGEEVEVNGAGVRRVASLQGGKTCGG